MTIENATGIEGVNLDIFLYVWIINFKFTAIIFFRNYQILKCATYRKYMAKPI